MALSIPYESSATISTAEYSLPNNSTTLVALTTPGIYQVFLDLSALTATEWYELLVYETVVAGGTKLVAHRIQITGVQADPVCCEPGFYLANGFDFTLRKVKGTDRAIGWSIRKVA